MEEVKVVNHNRMSPARRDMFLRVMDGNRDLIEVLHVLNGYKFCDNFLLWLAKNNITGAKLIDFLTTKFNNSVPAMVDHIVLQLNLNNQKINNPVELKLL